MPIVRNFEGLGIASSSGSSAKGSGGGGSWWGTVVGVVKNIDWSAVGSVLGGLGFGGGTKFPAQAAPALATAWYRRYLLRAPDAGGLAHWIGQIIADGPQWAFRNFSASPEYLRQAAAREDAGNGNGVGLEQYMTPAEATVLTWYRKYLGRNPDVSGLYHWVGELSVDGLNKAIGNFAGAPEAVKANVGARVAAEARAASGSNMVGAEGPAVRSAATGPYTASVLGNVSPTTLALGAAVAVALYVVSQQRRK